MAELDPNQTAAAPVEATPAPQLTSGQKLVAALPAEANQAETKPAEPTTPSLKDQLAELGFEGLTDDAEAVTRLVAAYREERQRNGEFAKTIKAELEQVRQSVKGEFTAPATEPAVDGKWWNPPEFDAASAAQYKTAEGWKPETPAEIRAKAEAAQRYYDKWANDLVQRPDQVLPPIVAQIAEQKIKEILGQVESQKTYEQQLAKIVDDNPWVYDRDPVSGQPKVDPTNRGYVLSADGQLINAHFAQLLNAGMPPDRAWHYAHLEFQAAKGTLSQKRENATAANGQLKEDMLARANGGTLPSRGASLPAPGNNGTTQNKRLKPGQRLIDQMHRDGTQVA